jgi:hypothetical protein
MKDDEVENYLRAISYKTDSLQVLSDALKRHIEAGQTLKVVSLHGTELNIS